MGTALAVRRPTNLFGKRFARAAVLMFALAGLVSSPATALPPGVGIVRSGDAFDPCLFSPRIANFAPESPSVDLGTSTRLSWSVQAPRGCGYVLSMTVSARPQINLTAAAPDWGIWTSSIAVGAQPQGKLAVQPAFNTVYMLVVAWGPNSSTSATTQVAVNLPLADRSCPDRVNLSTFSLICRRKVTINANHLAPLLVQALGTAYTTVIVLDGVELDLTPHLGERITMGGPITIADGVQLIGGRIAEPGKRFLRGPRLYVTPDPNVWDPVHGFDLTFHSHWPDPLFQILGDNVRISGVRLEGPGAPPDAWRTAIPQGPNCSNAAGCPIAETRGIKFVDRINIEIDHNEFYGWNAAAVEPAATERTTGPADPVWWMWTSRVTSDSSGIHYPAGPEPLYIHDNHFHNNFYPPSPAPWSSCSPASRKSCEAYLGYGVVASGTHVLIERNVFDVKPRQGEPGAMPARRLR